MANHILYQPSTSTHGKYLQRMLSAMEQGDVYLVELRAVMVEMLEGDGSTDAHYANIKTRFGFETDTKAKEAYAAINNCFDALQSVRVARDQLYNKLR
jgi:hypothetical protein